jgi:hypothetical protein
MYLMADANIPGQVDRLTKRMQAEDWSDFWTYLQLSLLTFADVDLIPADSDVVVWQRCQERRIFLWTSNRNAKEDDSLEATIRSQNTPQSLPVFTIGDADRISLDSSYCERVIEALFDYLLEAENIRGTGRLFLP